MDDPYLFHYFSSPALGSAHILTCMKRFRLALPIFTVLAWALVPANASLTDDKNISRSYRFLSTLRSYRITTNGSVAGTTTYFCDEWMESPVARRRIVSRFGSIRSITIITPTAIYDQMRADDPWTKRQPSAAERASLVKGRDFSKELWLDRLEFTYAGLVSLGTDQTRMYTFVDKFSRKVTRTGKVWIGANDSLPRRLEEHDTEESEMGKASVVETYDNFNVPPVIALPIVGGKSKVPATQSFPPSPFD